MIKVTQELQECQIHKQLTPPPPHPPQKVSVTPWGGGGGCTPRNLGLGGMCGPVLQILTLFHTKRCHFPHPFSDLTSKVHTSFQTWRRSQNATYMFTKTEIRSSLLGLRARTKKIFLKIHFEFAHYGFIS